MSIYIQQVTTADELKAHYGRSWFDPKDFKSQNFINGYDSPIIYAVSDEDGLTDVFLKMEWGFKNYWFDKFPVQTLFMAREDFQKIYNRNDGCLQVCLIPVTGIYNITEDRCQLITVDGIEIFSLAGIWMKQLNILTNKLERLFCIITEPMIASQIGLSNDQSFHFPIIIGDEPGYLYDGQIKRSRQYKIQQIRRPQVHITKENEFITFARKFLSGM